jgi:hypothetical protein
MGLSPEAIIGLVTLFVTCAPPTLLVMGWITRRRKTRRGNGLIQKLKSALSLLILLTGSTLQRISGPQEARGTCIPNDADVERRLRGGTALVWNHGMGHL